MARGKHSPENEGSDPVASPRLAEWLHYLDEGPVASESFMQDVEELPIQERESQSRTNH